MLRSRLQGQCLRGFTLVELIVSLALVAILAAMAVPSLADLIARKRVDGVANELMTVLRSARGLPLNYNKAIQLTFNRKSGEFSCYSVDDNVIQAANIPRTCDCANFPSPTCPVVAKAVVNYVAYSTVVVPDSSGVILDWSGDAKPSITFDVNGLPVGAASLTVDIKSSRGGTLRLSMNSAGNASLCSVSGHSAYPACPSPSPQ